MENITAQQKNKMAVNFGLMTGILYIVITSGVNLAVSNMITFYLLKLLGYIVYFIVIGVFAARIRTANGGYIEFREIFGAVFIMIVIAATMSFLYNYLYIYVIDPHYMEKIKTATLTFMQKMNLPQEKLDETAQKFDQQLADANHFHLGWNVFGLLGAFVIDSLFGLIVCLAVRKKRPMFQ